MQFILLTIIAALATTIAANPRAQPIPDPPSPSSREELDYPEPDPRFANMTLPHPGAEVHVPHITRRDQKYYGVYECKGQFFKGECHWTELKKGAAPVCLNRRWPNTYLASLGPDKGVTCDCFDLKDCKVKEWPFYGLQWPGVGDFPNCWAFKKFKLSDCPASIRCWVSDK